MNASTIIAMSALCISVVINVLSIGRFVGKIESLEKLIDFRLKRLEDKQDKYNHLQERLAVVENSDKVAHHRIDTLMRERDNG